MSLMSKRTSLAGVLAAAANQSPSEMGDGSSVTGDGKLPRGSTSGPSLAGVMMSRRIAKRLSSKFTKPGGIGTIRSSSVGIMQEKEPSYQMEPSRKFNSSLVEREIKLVLDSRMDGFQYHPKFCANMTKILSDEIKDKVKNMGYERYKIVCVVMISPVNGQALMASSRCSWDKQQDTYASYTFKNKHLVCNASVYGLYRE